MKQSLRVRAEGLRKAEELSIAVFLRFVGQSEVASWSLSREAGAELVLKAADAAPTGHVDEKPEAIIWLLDEGADSPTDGRLALRRPLQVETFGELLRTREAQLAVRAAPVAAIDLTAAIPAFAGGTDAYSGFDLDATHRLLRWPGNDVLLDQRHRKILASFLVSRHLSTLQLSSLSGIGQHTCIDFLQSLTAAGLLESRIPMRELSKARATLAENGPNTVPALAPPPPTTASSAPASATSGGLIGRLRKRLGL